MADWVDPDGKFVLVNIHAENSRCRLVGCAMHNPTMSSPMNAEGWPYDWYGGILRRACPHGLHHPDIDAARFHTYQGQADALIHGCDGCCDLDPATKEEN